LHPGLHSGAGNGAPVAIIPRGCLGVPASESRQ
jgi:hypothetical protein